MSNTNTDSINEFRSKLRDLLLQYNFTIEVDTGYYGNVKGVDFCIGNRRVVHTDYDQWDFDDTGHKSIEEIRRDLANSKDQP